MRLHSLLRAAVIASGLALALPTAGTFADDATGGVLSQKPPRSAGEPAIAATPSAIGLALSVPYKVIAGVATSAIPADYSGQDRRPICANLDETAQKAARDKVGGDLGKWLGKAAKSLAHLAPANRQGETCLEADIDYVVHRDGPVTAAAAGDRLRLSLPLSVTGHAGFAGHLARALGIDHKNFRGALTATADIRLAVGSDWCPRLAVEPGYSWRDKAQLEVAPGAWIDIDRAAGPKIRDLMRSAARKLEQAVPCDAVHRTAAGLWHRYDVPLDLPGDATLHVVATPLSVGLSGVRWRAQDALLTAGIEALVEATAAVPPALPATTSLPPLRARAPGDGRVDLQVPLRVGYDYLQAAVAERLAGRPFTEDTAAGRITIAVTGVEIYPSAGRLAVGLAFSATTPDPQMDATGRIYLVGEPVLDAAAQTLRVRDLSFTPQIDNRLWSVLSAALGKQILAAIQDHLVVDLKERVDPVRDRVTRALRDLAARQGVELALSDVSVEIRRIALADQALEVMVGVKGAAAATVDTVAALPRL
jgi:hypothetical protein